MPSKEAEEVMEVETDSGPTEQVNSRGKSSKKKAAEDMEVETDSGSTEVEDQAENGAVKPTENAVNLIWSFC